MTDEKTYNIKFVSDRIVGEEDGVKTYKAGKIYSFNKASADRWVKRGHLLVSDKEKAEKVEVEKKKEDSKKEDSKKEDSKKEDSKKEDSKKESTGSKKENSK